MRGGIWSEIMMMWDYCRISVNGLVQSWWAVGLFPGYISLWLSYQAIRATVYAVLCRWCACQVSQSSQVFRRITQKEVKALLRLCPVSHSHLKTSYSLCKPLTSWSILKDILFLWQLHGHGREHEMNLQEEYRDKDTNIRLKYVLGIYSVLELW